MGIHTTSIKLYSGIKKRGISSADLLLNSYLFVIIELFKLPLRLSAGARIFCSQRGKTDSLYLLSIM